MDIRKEIDSRPLTRAFSFSAEKDRALYGLKGILTGVVADQRLNEMELLFLDAWLKSQEYLSEDEDVPALLIKCEGSEIKVITERTLFKYTR